jgi:hypothetical protein
MTRPEAARHRRRGTQRTAPQHARVPDTTRGVRRGCCGPPLEPAPITVVGEARSPSHLTTWHGRGMVRGDPRTGVDGIAYRAVVEAESGRFLEPLASADLDAAVPSCPGWPFFRPGTRSSAGRARQVVGCRARASVGPTSQRRSHATARHGQAVLPYPGPVRPTDDRAVAAVGRDLPGETRRVHRRSVPRFITTARARAGWSARRT